MQKISTPQLLDSFVNATKGDVKRASFPDLETINWESLDYLGWWDDKRPHLGYIAAEVDGTLSTIMIKKAATPAKKKLMCSWCEDVITGLKAQPISIPRPGPAGRRGNTVGTIVCGNFACSANVRRTPSSFELGTDDPAAIQFYTSQRIATLHDKIKGLWKYLSERND